MNALTGAAPVVRGDDPIELRDRLAWRFFQGGENTAGIAWSPTERRFVLVYSCC